MFNQIALESLIRKVGKLSLDAREKDNNMFNVPDVEKEEFENPTVQGKNNSNQRASQKTRLDNSQYGYSLCLAKDKDNTDIAINWLVVLCGQLVDKVNELTAREDEVKKVQIEAKAKEERMEKKVVEKVESLSNENDELRQRSMKGNLIISSPKSDAVDTLFKRKEVEEGGSIKKESDVAMVTRVIEAKTGVKFQPEEVVACHPLGRATKDPTTWILRVQNRKPNSNFDILAAGMKTGRHPTTNTSFTKENVFLNHQLTPKRSKFLKEVVRVAHKANKIGKYMVDERGSIRVKKEKGGREDKGDRFRYYTINDKEELEKVINCEFEYFINKQTNTNRN